MVDVIRNPAVLVIDVQNDFCSRRGLFKRAGMEVLSMQKMAVRIAKFLKYIKKLGIPIVFIVSHYDFKYLPSNIREVYEKKGLSRLCTSGTFGANLFMLKPNCNVFVKCRYDAFTNHNFVEWLKLNRIKSLILTGCQTDVCVDSTARSGFMRGYYIIAVEDCLASSNVFNHRHTLKFMSDYYGAQIRCSKTPLKRLWKGDA